jgi:hypothetical protein
MTRALPGTRLRIHGRRIDQPVDLGGLCGFRRGARALRTAPGSAVRKSAEPLEGTVTSPNGFPVRQVQRAHVLRDPPCLEKVVIAPLRRVGRRAE